MSWAHIDNAGKEIVFNKRMYFFFQLKEISLLFMSPGQEVSGNLPDGAIQC